MSFQTLNLDSLRQTVTGLVALPQDPAFAPATFAWNVATSHRPQVVVDADSEADVQEAVRWAAQHGLPIAVQATGHGQPRPCDGLLVRTGKLNQVSVNADARTARVGAGCVWREVNEAAGAFGLGGLCGSAPHVGVLGYTLGGGFGLLLRQHGLAVDRLLGVSVVLADGSLVRASRDENDDLFWALQGGGGAFGIVTELEIELVPVDPFFGGAAFWDYAHAESVFERYATWAASLPEAATTSLHVMNFPPVPFVPEPLRGRSMVYVTAAVLASPGEGEAMVAPLRDWPGFEFDSFHPMPFTEAGCVHNDPVDPLPFNGGGVLLKDLDAARLADILRAYGPPQESPQLMLQIRALGGEAARQDAGPLRDARNAGGLAYLLGLALPDNVAAMERHREQFFADISDNVVRRGPLNWVGENDTPAERYRDVYDDADWARLVEIKRMVDPANLFRYASVGLVLAETD